MENYSLFKGLLRQFASANKDAIAFSIYDGQNITNIPYPQFADDVLRAAGYFREKNICGQHVAMIAPNSYEWFVAFFAIITSGNVAVLLNSALSSDMLRGQGEQADVSMFWGEESENPEFRAAMNDAQWLTYDEMKMASPMRLDDIHHTEPNETIVLLGTSGTTGKSKIVEITCNNFQHSLNNNEFAMPELDRWLLALPLYHVGGVVAATLMLQRSKTVCIGRGLRYIFLDMPVLNPTYVPLVPAMMESIEKLFKKSVEAEERAKYVGNNLKFICAAGAAPKKSTCQYLISQGIVIIAAYGMTETTGSGTGCELSEDNVGTIGKILGNMLCCIQDGEILLKGPAVMKGYYKDPEETAKVMEDGWLHTGDMGYCDEDGYYYITGRKKNVIILSNGENVNPEEIEAVFGKCEAVEECLVYSDGKGICADIFTKDQDSAKSFIKAYNETMPMYRQVYKVNYSAEPLPKTGSGKIKRKENL